MTVKKKRCAWIGKDALMKKYHDKEWGKALHNDKKLFEFLVLDAFQAGLSWSTILNKRENFRKAFDNFNAVKIAKYTQKDIERLMGDAGIVRNKLKIESTITNAQNFLKVKKEFGSFSKYIWNFVGNEPIVNKFKNMKEIPAKSNEAEIMSKELKKRGFRFVGPTICYAFMQAAGLVNDHTIDCFRYKELTK